MKVTLVTGSPNYHTNPDCYLLKQSKRSRKIELSKIPNRTECSACKGDTPKNTASRSFIDRKVRCWVCSETYESMSELEECLQSHSPPGV